MVGLDCQIQVGGHREIWEWSWGGQRQRGAMPESTCPRRPDLWNEPYFQKMPRSHLKAGMPSPRAAALASLYSQRTILRLLSMADHCLLSIPLPTKCTFCSSLCLQKLNPLLQCKILIFLLHCSERRPQWQQWQGRRALTATSNMTFSLPTSFKVCWLVGCSGQCLLLLGSMTSTSGLSDHLLLSFLSLLFT